MCMQRLALVILAVAVSSACASTGAYSPRPFPNGPGGAAPRVRPSVPRPATASPQPRTTHGPFVPGDRVSASTAVLTTAMGLTGVPYRLGGADPTGFDCSGFVQYVLRQHAIAMPRTVAEQFVVGDVTPAVEAGDLVFVQTIGSKASHVGIAIDAYSFVHAPNSRGVVRVDRLDAPYWAGRFLGARRVF
jgi:cell wall-associated NlpC family hydrolase